MPGDRWIPKSEDELRDAVAGRVLVENQYLDFKAMIGAGDKAMSRISGISPELITESPQV